METLRKLTNDLLELRYKVRSDDNRVTEQQVQSWIMQQRAIWISNELNKGHFDPAFRQEIPTSALPVIAHPTLGTDYKITSVRLPRLVQINMRPAILEVNDGNHFTGTRYPLVPMSSLRYTGNRRFDSTVIHCSYSQESIILKRPEDDTAGDFDDIDSVSVIGIFENPMDLKDYSTSGGAPVYWEDEIYPINQKLYTYMREQIVKINFQVEAKATEDKINDSTADD